MKSDRTARILSALEDSGQLPRTTREIKTGGIIKGQPIDQRELITRLSTHFSYRSPSPPG